MKKIITILIGIAFIGCTGEKTHTIDIKDYRTAEQPEIIITDHENGDVEVFRSGFMGNSYEIIYFHDYSGKLKDYHATYSAPDEFDNAYFSWEDDTTITVTLNNSSTRDKYEIVVFGNGSYSGLKINE